MSTVPGVALAQQPSPAREGVALTTRSESPSRPLAPTSTWAERPFAVDATIGSATPLGNLGLSLEYAPIRWVSLGAGLGTNIDGLQLAGMLRVRFTPNNSTSVFAGGGYSTGPCRQGFATRYGMLSAATGLVQLLQNDPTPPWRHWPHAHWANLELGAERRRPDGLDARAFVGLALLLNPNANAIQPHPADDMHAALAVVPVVLYLGAALGFSL